jgi:hypothetical protein
MSPMINPPISPATGVKRDIQVSNPDYLVSAGVFT